jgi:uncharacterized protein Yka (UPF0111/DUF47 family)
MLGWFQALLPKEDNFFRLFDAHAATLIQGAEALRKVLEGGDEVPRWCQRIVDHEHEADAVAREVLLAVRRSFITPFDRSDIRGLTNALDDAIDQMQKTAKVVTLYEPARLRPAHAPAGRHRGPSGDLTVEAVALLPAMRKQHGRLNELTEQIVRLESDSDALYDAGHEGAVRGPSPATPWPSSSAPKLYDHLEKVVDRFEDVANRINGVVVEHL